MSRFQFGIFQNENFVDLSLYQFGYEECDPLHSFGPAIRNHFLFHYIFSGKGKLMSTDEQGTVREYALSAGQGFLIWPLQHNFYSADAKDPWVYAWIEFDGLKAKELVAEAGLSFNHPLYTSSNPEDREKMKNEIFQIVKNKDGPPLALIGHLYLFMDAFISSSSARKKTTGGSLRNFYARESLSFIDQHYQNDISVEDIAEYCKLDRSYLGKIFRSVLNTSPQEFLIRYRINKACEIMKTTDHTISETSLMVGYQDQFTFSKAFKNIMGKSPRDWRNANKLRENSGK
jgi:AraC-like DNA-binding protein